MTSPDRYGPYRRQEAIVPARWIYDDYECVWVEVHEVPEWLHVQRQALSEYTRPATSAPAAVPLLRLVDQTPSEPARSLPREVSRPFDGECERCGCRLTTRANKRRKVCPTCVVIAVNGLSGA